ncbi:SpaA isopeptide-forming pilin-related protein [Arthrobacter sp. MYb213]|uniref:SpaA isopeptide-forming pilin-related protein n=1 Tax=Arthrobacter sp. MYb213 TaxID=1848595 RepID=UPI000CFBEF16|nr:SpaA isopeptide-forming pilin-related protein [Arthrobacter sp. MYb213]PRB72740.1 hypothetical protein CQ011_03660 [Arthrobacter sp. MYb213]
MAAGAICADYQENSVLIGGFEIDGNLCANSTTNDDWTTVSGQPAKSDNYGSLDLTQFTEGASESNWPWNIGQIEGSGPGNDKSDVGNVYAYSTAVGGDVLAYLGFERNKNNGSVQYVVELNNRANTTGPIPNRTTGDLRIQVLQDGNSALTFVSAHTWLSTGNLSGSWVPLNSLEGFVGRTNVTKKISSFQGLVDAMDVKMFGELAINLTDLFEGSSRQCSGNYGFVNIRSAASPGEEPSLKDWVAPISLDIPSTCASVVVEKKWVIDGEPFDNGDQPEDFQATLNLTGRSAAQFGETYSTRDDGSSYEVPNVVAIGETVTGLPAGCTNVSSGDLGEKTLAPGINRYTVTNTVTCTTLTLKKNVVGEAEASAWTLTASGPTNLSGITGSSAVSNSAVTPGPYTIGEKDGPTGYELTDVSCVGATVSDTNSITITAGSKVTCTLTNTQQVDLTVTKTWIVNGTEYVHGDQPIGDAALTIDDKTATFGATSTGHLIGDKVNIAETMTGTIPALCEVTSSTIAGVDGLAAIHTMTGTPKPNVVDIVNTVDCVQQLTLIKDVDNKAFAGTSTEADWTLSATGDGEVITGKTGDTSITEAAVSVGTYALSEDESTPGYQAGTWACEGTGAADGANIKLELGQEATCTIVNTALPGSATWTKTNVAGDLLAGAEWTVTGPLGDNSETIVVTDCIATGCTGPDMDPAKGKFALEQLKWGSYTLEETTAPPGYIKDTKVYPFDVAGKTLNVELAAITNKQQAGPTLPLTGGIGRDQIYLLGGGVLILGLAILGGKSLRIRRNRNLG